MNVLFSLGLFNLQGQLVQPFSAPKWKKVSYLKNSILRKPFQMASIFYKLSVGSNTAFSKIILTKSYLKALSNVLGVFLNPMARKG